MNSAFDRTKKAKLLRKAAYWLTDYASCFNGQDAAPGVLKFRNKIRKLAADCRKASKSND